jgi:DNA polymerase-3 subunit epsilon
MLNVLTPEFWAKVLWGQHPIPDEFYLCKYSLLPLMSIDLELTDLNIEKSKITSIGWVEGKMFDVDLSSAHYDVVRASGDLKQSPVIHGLCAKDIAKGSHIKQQIDILKAYCQSHVWVFHNATLDMRMLDKMWKLLDLEPVTVTTIDTMLLHVYTMEKTHGFVPSGSVTLGSAREYYGLSAAPEHNSLDDALATLTLLYAQFYQLDKSGHMSLKSLSHTRAIKTFTLGKTKPLIS